MFLQRKPQAMYPVALTAARRLFLTASLGQLQHSRGPRGQGDGNYSNGGGAQWRERGDGGGGGYQQHQRRDGGGQRGYDDGRRAPQRDYGDRGGGSRYGERQVDREDDRGRYGSRNSSVSYDRQQQQQRPQYQARDGSSEEDRSFSSERRQPHSVSPSQRMTAVGARGPRSVDVSNAEIRDAHNAVRESMDEPPLPSRRPRVGDMAGIAKELVDLKHRHKSSKSKREMASLKSKAFDLLDSLRIDMSTQDEKSVSVILNCAVFFHYPSRRFAIPDCVKWSLENIAALSPQNVALFAHALGELRPFAWLKIDSALRTVLDVVSRTTLSNFSLVELIMLLQACAHANVLQFDDLQQELASDAVSRVKAAGSAPGTATPAAPSRTASPGSAVKPSDLSALLECAMHPQSIFARRESLKRDTFEACAAFQFPVGAIHSNNIVTFVTAFSAARSLGYAAPSREMWIGLLQRATEVAHFFTDEQLGVAISASVAAQKCDGGAAAPEVHDAFRKAVCDRVQALMGKIPWHCVPSLLRGFHDARMSFSEAAAQTFASSLIQELAWRGGEVRVIASSLSAAVVLNDAALSSSGLYEAVAAHLSGVRLARKQRASKRSEVSEDGESDAAVTPVASRLHDEEDGVAPPSTEVVELDKLASVFAHRFRRLVECHLHLERLNSLNAPRVVVASSSLASLSTVVREASKLCNATQLIRGLTSLATYPAFDGRDAAFDNALVAVVEQRFRADTNLLNEVPGSVLLDFANAICGAAAVSSANLRPPIASNPEMKSLAEHAKRAAETNSVERERRFLDREAAP